MAKTARENCILAASAAALAALNLVFYGGGWKVLALLFCLGAAGLCFFRLKKAPRFPVPALALTAYMVLCAVSGIFAVSGKFFIKEYCKLLMAFGVFLFIVLTGGDKEKTARRTAFFIAALGALYSFVSVELGSTAFLLPLFRALTGYDAMEVGFEAGTRLTGVFGNGNVLAGVLALGIFMSLYLLEKAETKNLRAVSVVLLSINAFGFLLSFSLGGTAFLLLSLSLYLAAAGKRRASSLLRMLEAALPAGVFVFPAVAFFGSEAALATVPLLSLAASALCACLLELYAYPRLEPVLRGRRRTAWALAAVALAAAAYLAAALTVAAPYHYGEKGVLRRAVYLPAGSHTIAAASDGFVGLAVRSQDKTQVMTGTDTAVLRTWAQSGQTYSFEVPQGAEVEYISVWGPADRHLYSLTIDGKEEVPLSYPLLPGFIANRLQGILANQNAIQRTVFFSDGMKLFEQKPVLGGGLGFFESAACSVQSFYYETKYVHNQYIQVLIDGGVLGLAAYLFALISLALALWRGRKTDGPLYPALCAALFMIAGHSAEEVTMSMSVYLPLAFAVFALVALCYGRPLEALPGRLCRWSAGALAVVFAALIAMNLQAAAGVAASGGDYASFMAALSKAAASDPFDYNDYKISYVWNSAQSDSAAIRQKAEGYADGLEAVRSNSITGVLLQYRLITGSYDKAMECALFGAMNNRSDPQVWNDYFGYLNAYLPADSLTPALAAGVVRLKAALDEANAELMDPVALTEENQSYIAAAQALAGS